MLQDIIADYTGRDRMRDAASAAMQLIRSGVQLGAMEIMDDVQMNVINRAGATPFRKWDEVPTLFFKFSGTKSGVEDSLKLTTQIAKSNKSKDFIFAKTDKEAHDLWTARKESLWSMLSLRKEGDEVWSTDVCTPISRLPDIIGTWLSWHLPYLLRLNLTGREI
jgi:D-lactate dehydrogenase (cytochrome)